MSKLERQLEEQGYSFTGIYGRSREEIKAKAAELRKQGHKARVIYEPSSPLSRSHSSGGYSVYWIESEASKIERQRKQVDRVLANLCKEQSEIEARLIAIAEEISAAHDLLEKLELTKIEASCS